MLLKMITQFFSLVVGTFKNKQNEMRKKSPGRNNTAQTGDKALVPFRDGKFDEYSYAFEYIPACDAIPLYV